MSRIGDQRRWPAVVLVFLSACSFSAAQLPAKFDWPPIKHPPDNLPSDAKVALGEQLFFDARLSRTNQVSCATCHNPAGGWSNGERFGTGVENRRGIRNVPTLFNVAHNQSYFWDGRAGGLEQQAVEPIKHQAEMDMPLDELAKKINGVEGYRRQFRDVFGGNATPDSIAKAIASFERTIFSRDLPLDRFLGGDKRALSDATQRGMKLFFGDARCHVCHSGPNFTDQKFHNVGVGIGSRPPDLGRFAISGRDEDRGAFKTPTLREIAHTPPYMHDGSFQSLEQVVRHYNFGGVTETENPYRDEALEVLYLAEDQVSDLVTFLREGLSSSRLPDYPTPNLPP